MKTNLPSPLPRDVTSRADALSVLAQVPEEQLWLANFPSKSTRETYRDSVAAFVRFGKLKSAADFGRVSRGAVIAWRDHLEASGRSPRTIKTRLSALSSLYDHLREHNEVESNPFSEVKRPKLRARRGVTKALTAKQARRILDAPPEDTLQGLRDRAILSIGLQAGPRRSEIAALRVKDVAEEQGYPALFLRRKGGAQDWVVIHPVTENRIASYLAKAGHGDEKDGSLFRPVRDCPGSTKKDRHLTAKQVNNVFKRWCRACGVSTEHFSAHSMRATFITEALNAGAALEDVQNQVGHAKPDTTKLYDRRDYNPERAPSLFVTYG